MNIFRVDIGYDSEDSMDGVAYETTYLTHTDDMNESKFKEICSRAKDDCIRKYEDVCLYNMILVLTELYGFESINVNGSWSC